jgi:DNA-binding transcriptional regulator YhcF (GntR family)
MGDDIITVPERVAGGSYKEPDGGSHERKFVPLPTGFSVNQGWVKIHRRITEWEWYSDLAVYRLFTHLLLTVNHEEKNWKGQSIKAGQKITSLQHLALETGLSLQSIRTALVKLKSTGELTYHTTNRFTHICIVKWAQYQVKSNTPVNTPVNNLSTTTKEVKKRRSKEEHLTSIATSVAEPINEFIGYFKEINPSYETLYRNMTQRAASERLLKKHGLEPLRKTLLIIEKTNGMQYAPVITTPLELEKHGGRLKAFVEKEKITMAPKWRVWN